MFRGAAGKSEHVTECRTITQETVKNLFCGTGHSNNNITDSVLSIFYARRYFVTALKIAFLSVITGHAASSQTTSDLLTSDLLY